MKNPFMVNLTNSSFDELFNWNNNILQLDATSKLYGQRVDFLHTGTIQILGTVMHIDQEHKEPLTEKVNKEDNVEQKKPQIE